MKRIKVIGAGGSGKSHFLARHLYYLENNIKNFNFVVLSYTHTGKNEIINIYRKLKGEKEIQFKQNVDKSRTFHSFIYYLLNLAGKDKKNLLDFLKNKDAFNLVLKIKEILKINDNLTIFNLAYDYLKKELNLKEERKEKLWKLFLLGQKEDYIYFNKIKNLYIGELIFLTLLKEPLLFDKGYLINPFTNKKIMTKQEYVKYKYEMLTDQFFPLNMTKEVIEKLKEEEVLIPINPIYLISVLWEKRDLFDEIINKAGVYYDTLIIDEAQDFPTLAIDFIEYLKITDKIVMAGDPYQAIYMDLGYNSYFFQEDYFGSKYKMPHIYRYSQEYLDFLKKQFIKIPETLEQTTSKCNNKTFFTIKNKTFFNFNIISNDPERVLITNNIKQLKNRYKEFLFCPYYEVFSSGDLKEQQTLMEAYFIDVFLNEKKNEKFFFDKYGVVIMYYLQDLNRLKNFLITLNKDKKDEIVKINSQKELLNYLKENFLSFLKHKGYIFYTTTHRAKGKTIKETLFYYENYGLYLHLIRGNEDFDFIHYLMRYVALTRPKNEIVYLK